MQHSSRLEFHICVVAQYHVTKSNIICTKPRLRSSARPHVLAARLNADESRGNRSAKQRPLLHPQLISHARLLFKTSREPCYSLRSSYLSEVPIRRSSGGPGAFKPDSRKLWQAEHFCALKLLVFLLVRKMSSPGSGRQLALGTTDSPFMQCRLGETQGAHTEHDEGKKEGTKDRQGGRATRGHITADFS